jgi:hypothetical protein
MAKNAMLFQSFHVIANSGKSVQSFHPEGGVLKMRKRETTESAWALNRYSAFARQKLRS